MSRAPSEIRVDLDTATRDELVAEVQRLNEVSKRWSEAWQGIVKANTDAWVDQVTVLSRAVDALRELVAHLPGDIQVPSAYVVGAHMALANLPGVFRQPQHQAAPAPTEQETP